MQPGSNLNTLLRGTNVRNASRILMQQMHGIDRGALKGYKVVVEVNKRKELANNNNVTGCNKKL